MSEASSLAIEAISSSVISGKRGFASSLVISVVERIVIVGLGVLADCTSCSVISGAEEEVLMTANGGQCS